MVGVVLTGPGARAGAGEEGPGGGLDELACFADDFLEGAEEGDDVGGDEGGDGFDFFDFDDQVVVGAHEGVAEFPEGALGPDPGLFQFDQGEARFQGFGCLEGEGTFDAEGLPVVLQLVVSPLLHAVLIRLYEMSIDSG